MVEGNVSMKLRIDHAFWNIEWMNRFGEFPVEISKPGLSDHSPLTISIGRTHRISSRFRLLNTVTDTVQFKSALSSVWTEKSDNHSSALAEWLLIS